jgi:hypothetical protein
MGKTAIFLVSLMAMGMIILAVSARGQSSAASPQDELTQAVYSQVTYSEVQAADGTKLFVDPSQRLEITRVKQAGQWAVVEARLVWADGSGPVPTSGVIFLARMTPQGWQPVHRGHPDYPNYLESVPNELISAQRDLLR